MGREEAVDRQNPCKRIPIKLRRKTTRHQQEEYFLSDFENNAATLEATEPANEGTSKLKPPSAFVEMNRNLPESSSRALLKTMNKDSS